MNIRQAIASEDIAAVRALHSLAAAAQFDNHW
jgi:hypothetical protein